MIEKEIKIQQWGDGEWVNEPDIIEFEHKDIKCCLCRNMGWEGHKMDHLSGGNLCGYVCVPKDHEYFGKEYSQIDIEVHGGLTFGEIAADEFWIGFDCAHSHDIIPSIEKFREEHRDDFFEEIKKRYQNSPILKKSYENDDFFEEIKKRYPNSPILKKSYKNVEFCMFECKSMVEQLLHKK